jgi:hypothetical protein
VRNDVTDVVEHRSGDEVQYVSARFLLQKEMIACKSVDVEVSGDDATPRFEVIGRNGMV